MQSTSKANFRSNAAPPSDSSSEEDDDTLRPVKRIAIIDGCNVLHNCAGLYFKNPPKQRKEERRPDAIGLMLIGRQLMSEGFDLRIVMPIHFMKEAFVANFFVLEEFKRLGFVHVIEVRKRQDDDLEILQMAKLYGGFVLSNDQFRGFRRTHPALQHVIENRVIHYTFKAVPISTIGGKEGMSQVESRLFTGMELTIKAKSHAMFARSDEDEMDYQAALTQRSLRSKARCQQILCMFEIMLDFLQQDYCYDNKLPAPALEYFDVKVHSVVPCIFKNFYWYYNEMIRKRSTIFHNVPP